MDHVPAARRASAVRQLGLPTEILDVAVGSTGLDQVLPHVPSLPMAGFNMARVPSATVLPAHGGVGKRESLLGSKVWRAHTHAQMRVRTHVRAHTPFSRSTH